MSNDDKMHEWTSVNGAAVRQLKVQQETTMGRTGILPEACYHEELRDPLSPKEVMVQLIPNKIAWNRRHNIDEMVQYDTDVYEQEIIQNEIGNEATFLFGANSQFCRSIKFNRTFF